MPQLHQKPLPFRRRSIPLRLNLLGRYRVFAPQVFNRRHTSALVGAQVVLEARHQHLAQALESAPDPSRWRQWI